MYPKILFDFRTNENKFFHYLLRLVNCFVLCFFTFGLIESVGAQKNSESSVTLESIVKQTLKKNAEVLRFMQNKGQLENDDILYYLESKQGTVLIEKSRIRFVAKEYVHMEGSTNSSENRLTGTHTFTLNFNNYNPKVKAVLGSTFGTKYNYILGNDPNQYTSGVIAAKDVTLEDVFTGIDIRIYSNDDGSLEFDWILDPGADYRNIDLLVEGQDKLSVDKDGNLDIGLRFTKVKFNVPESYQITENGKKPVKFSFDIKGGKSVGFKTNHKVDPNLPLIIDPILSWGTFMDGNTIDFDQYLFAIQVDPADGMVYCAGGSNQSIVTNAAPYDANGYLNTVGGLSSTGTPRVAILYRINSSGTDLVDLTLYGPNTVGFLDQVVAYGLSLAPSRVYICG